LEALETTLSCYDIKTRSVVMPVFEDIALPKIRLAVKKARGE